MYRIAVMLLICNVANVMCHNVSPVDTPSPTQIAAVSHFGSQQHGPMFLEFPVTRYILGGDGKPVATKTVVYHTKQIWNEDKQCFESTPLVKVSESFQYLPSIR